MGGIHAYFSKGNIKIGIVLSAGTLEIMKLVDDKHTESYQFDFDDDIWFDKYYSKPDRDPFDSVEYRMYTMICDRYNKDGYKDEGFNLGDDFDWGKYEEIPVTKCQLPIEFFA